TMCFMWTDSKDTSDRRRVLGNEHQHGRIPKSSRVSMSMKLSQSLIIAATVVSTSSSSYGKDTQEKTPPGNHYIISVIAKVWLTSIRKSMDYFFKMGRCDSIILS